MNIWSGSYGLGDILLMTAPCKFRSDLCAVLPKKAERFKFLFDGIADVHFTDSAPNHSCASGHGTYAERLMNFCGLYGFDPLPRINVSEKSIMDANDILGSIKVNTVLKTNCASHWAHIREPASPSYWDKLVNKHGLTLFSNADAIAETIPSFINRYYAIIDLDLETLTGAYHIMGKYVGVDTGDVHLMLACGGSCEVHVPPSIPQYQHAEWHYKNTDRVNYIIW